MVDVVEVVDAGSPLFRRTKSSHFLARAMEKKASYSRLSKSEVKAIYEQVKRHVTPSGNKFGCDISNYAPVKVKSGERSYSQVRFKSIKYHCHIIACMINRDCRPPSNGEEASHLCHTVNCVRPEHLTFESGDVNKSRLCCRLFGHLPTYRCPHTPSCLNASA